MPRQASDDIVSKTGVILPQPIGQPFNAKLSAVTAQSIHANHMQLLIPFKHVAES